MGIVKNEPNLQLFLNTHVNGVEMDGQRIIVVIAQNVITGEKLKFSAPVFADCSGDGILGYLAGSDYRYEREARKETGETLAPKEADKLTLGTSVMLSGKVISPSRKPRGLELTCSEEDLMALISVKRVVLSCLKSI